MLWGLLLSRDLISCTTGKKAPIFFNDKLNCTKCLFLVLISGWIYLGYLQFFVQPLFSCSFCRLSTAFFAQNTTCFQKHVYAFIYFLGKLLASALKFRKLLLKFLKNSRCRIGPFAILKSFSISAVTLLNEMFLFCCTDKF
jgi:hypothetical protein